MLQESKTIEVGGRTYEVAPPSLATLVKVSELVSQMPEIDSETERPISEVLRVAKDCRVIADIIAVTILGVKKKHNWFNMFFSKNNKLKELSSALAHDKTPKELSEILTDLLVNNMEAGFFLSTSISLSEVNMTKPTKETTARGQ